MFYKKDILRNFAKFTRKDLCQGLFFKKITGLKLETLLKRAFSCEFCEIFKSTLFSQNTSGGGFFAYKQLFTKNTQFSCQFIYSSFPVLPQFFSSSFPVHFQFFPCSFSVLFQYLRSFFENSYFIYIEMEINRKSCHYKAGS